MREEEETFVLSAFLLLFFHALLFFNGDGIRWCAAPSLASAPRHLFSLTVSHCIIWREPDRAGVGKLIYMVFQTGYLPSVPVIIPSSPIICLRLIARRRLMTSQAFSLPSPGEQGENILSRWNWKRVTARPVI